MDVIRLVRIGSDKPELYACPKCGALSSPRIYAATGERAHKAAIEMAQNCCAPRFCEDCGGEVPKGWLVCAPCRERRMLRKAERVEWDGDCMVAEGDTFASEPSELEGAAYCHPCSFEPFRLDLQNLIESAADNHHEDICDTIECDELKAVELAIDAFNKAQPSGSWYPDTKCVIVLDEEAFAELLGQPAAPNDIASPTDGG